MTKTKKTFYCVGDFETYYVDHRGDTWLLQHSDGGSPELKKTDLPETANLVPTRMVDELLLDCAGEIDRSVCEGTLRVDGDTAFALLGIDFRASDEVRADAIDHIASLYRAWLCGHGFDSMDVIADKRSDYGTHIDRDSTDFWSRHEDDLVEYVERALTLYEVAV